MQQVLLRLCVRLSGSVWMVSKILIETNFLGEMRLKRKVKVIKLPVLKDRHLTFFEEGVGLVEDCKILSKIERRRI